MKTLREYRVRAIQEKGMMADYMYTALIGTLWAMVLADSVNEIQMDKEEYEHFCLCFLLQLPHDWDRKTFMGVTIINKEYENNS